MGATRMVIVPHARTTGNPSALPRRQRRVLDPSHVAVIFPNSPEKLPYLTSPEIASVAGQRAEELKVRNLVERMAGVDLPVLLVSGGTSVKNDTARLIHRLSPRRNRVFMQITCSSFLPPALEQTLFGQDITTPFGAVVPKHGLFEACHGGTVFVDDITSMPSQLQARLVTLLDENWICRVKGRKRLKVDVRLVVSISMETRTALETGRLRYDLYRRLDCLTLSLPQNDMSEENRTRVIRSLQPSFDPESKLRLAALRNALSALQGGTPKIGNT